MMKNSILFFSLFAGMFLFPPNGVASYKSTHTSTPKPEPAFQFEQTDKTYKTAAVCFLGVGDCDNEISYGKGGDGEDYTVDTAAQCKNEGFILNNCNSVQVPEGYCPYNKSYVTRCKCASNLVTCPAGQVGVGKSCDEMYASCECDPALVSCSAKENGTGASCGGRYESCVCKPEYQYTSSNCSYPRSVSGDSCGGQYTDCVCPAGVDEGPYGCAEYYPSPCSSVCKVAYSDNCHIRESVNVPYYCEKYWDDCPSKCEVAAIDNCINRTAVSTPYGCESYYSDCSSKCQTAYGDNCRNRSDNSCPYGCQSYWSDCSSKCQTCYADNCRNKTAVSVPTNAHCTSYYSDCSSKCSAWSCDSGYNQSGASCVQEKKTCADYGYEDSLKFGIGITCSQVTVSNLKCYRCTQKAVSCPGGRPGSSCACGGTHSGVGFAAAHFCVEQVK